MRVISSAELRSNMKKGLGIANKETTISQKGKTETCILAAQQHLEPDEDLARAIPAEDFFELVKEDMRAMYLAKTGK